MRIAWWIYGGIDQLTGGYVYDRCIVDGLRAAGDDVEVVSVQPGQGGAAAALAHLDVLVGDELCFRELHPLLAEVRRLRQAGQVTPRCILLVHHLTCWETNQVSELEEQVVRWADVVITTSQTSARRIQRELGVASEACIPGADRLARYPRVERAEGEALRLLFVGTWTERKGLLVLLQALASLDARNYRLQIVGDDARDLAYTQRVRAFLMGASQVNERSSRLGQLSDEQLARAYADADVLILPSYFEGYGMVLSEARRAGVALIASGAGAISEVVTDGVDARLFPPGDVAALATSLAQLIESPAELRCLQQVECTYPSWQATIACFRSALNRG